MKPIAHRGLWNVPEKGNSLESLQEALDQGFSLETDLRSFRGSLVISHDPIHSRNDWIPFQQLLNVCKQASHPLFINIKEDGLVSLLRTKNAQLSQFQPIFFDMSGPQLFEFSRHFPPSMLCTRISDFEPYPVAPEHCDWLWIDCFRKEMNQKQLETLITQFPTKKLAFVSPELHHRNPTPFWETLKEAIPSERTYYLCTDQAHLAVQFWNS